jgi:hypothetical protein
MEWTAHSSAHPVRSPPDSLSLLVPPRGVSSPLPNLYVMDIVAIYMTSIVMKH